MRRSARPAVLLILALSLLSLPASLRAGDADDWIAGQLDSLIKLYRHLHQHPELSHQEEQTAARMAEELRELGIEVTTGVGGHGVVGVPTNGSGPTLLLRADMDALPVTEQTGLPYASKVKVKNAEGVEVGVMHACGHDMHMTNLIGVARWLTSHKQEWSGTIVFILQPAEEVGAGAVAMLRDGLFDRFPKPDFALALHVDSHLPAGKVGYRAGYAMANTDSVTITVRGQGGHGSAPHGAIDPIVQAAQLVLDLQTIVSREISPLEPAVVTVGAIHGGTKHNIIPSTCELQLTVRSYSPEIRRKIRDAIERKAKAVAASHRAPEPAVVFKEGTPSLYNDEPLVDRVVPALQQALGEEKVIAVGQSMGGEDFSQYRRQGVLIFMYRLGAVSPARFEEHQESSQPLPALHSPQFYPDVRETLTTGLKSMTAAVTTLLPPRKK